MRRFAIAFSLLVASGILTGASCSAAQVAGGTIAGIAGVTWYGSRSPGQEIEQVYYLGVYDPQEQIPAAVYRITVRGQASAISSTKFGSGWVPAGVIDSLGTRIEMDKKTGQVKFERGDAKDLSNLETGRRMVLFGPEGFREVPKDHRLVIVMGSSPESFFSAVDEVLGATADALDEQRYASLKSKLLSAVGGIKSERDRLGDLDREIQAGLKE